MSTQEVADILQVSDGYVKKLCQRGDLQATRLGAGWRILRSDLQKLLNIEDEPSISTIAPQLITDLRSAAELIRSLDGQAELAARLSTHADWLASQRKEENME